MLSLLLAVATTTPLPVDNTLLVPTKFLAYCKDVDTEYIEKQWDLLNKARSEKDGVEPLSQIMRATACGTFVSTAMATVSAADSYTVQGHKICVPQSWTAMDGLEQVRTWAREHPEALNLPDFNSLALVLVALGERGSCP